MGPLSLIPILPIVLVALVTLKLVSLLVPITVVEGHYGTIDGWRGYLAFFVFLHHSSIWFFFLRSGHWRLPPSRLYSHFGPTSVAFFFMITAFLFFGKLINAKKTGIDWLKLYVSRILRIMPLYWTVVSFLFVIVLVVSEFQFSLPLKDILAQMASWLVFMSPDINRLAGTGLIIAGVTGSLAFEWLFYCSLALIGFMFFKLRTPIIVLSIASFFLIFFAAVIYFYYPHLAWLRIFCFSGGILAAFLVRDERVRKLASRSESSLILVALLAIMVYFFPGPDSLLPVICGILVFIGIACGNSLFGILSLKISRQLGQISYSIFILHGLFLFLTFNYIIGAPSARHLSPSIYWIVIASISVALVVASAISYTFIELPFMNAAPKATAALRNFLVNQAARKKELSGNKVS